MIKREISASENVAESRLPVSLENPGSRLTPEIFDELYEALFPRIYNYLAYRTANREEAEDLTALVFERMVSHYHQFEPRRGSFENWIFAIARHAFYNQSRRRKRHPQTVLEETLEDDSQNEPTKIVLQQEELVRLKAYLSRLPDRDREIIALRYGANLSHRQIGEIMKMRENNVAVTLGRALRRLRQLFEADEIAG